MSRMGRDEARWGGVCRLGRVLLCNATGISLMHRLARSRHLRLESPASLAVHADPRQRRVAARRPDCPLDVLDGLAHDACPGVRLLVACREDVRYEALRVLSTDDLATVRRASEAALIRASGLRERPVETGYDYVSGELARNPNTPRVGLERLARHEHWLICHHLVHNPRCPVASLTHLVAHDHWMVRQGVAGHPSTPLSTLRVLASDRHVCVRDAAAGSADSRLGRTERPRVAHSSWEARMLDSWPGDPAWGERLLDASDPAMSPGDLAALACYPHWTVREAAALHRATPAAAIRELANDHHPAVQRAALSR